MSILQTKHIIVSSILISVFATSIYAEGKHKHSHGDAHWASPKEAANQKNPIKSDKDSISRGAITYASLCVSCHGVHAEGDGNLAASLKPKPTNLKAMSGGHTDGDFAWKIANGRGAMPGWKDHLSENDIWDLVNFIQNLKNKGIENKEQHNHKDHKH